MGLCWYCHWGWAVPVADLYDRYAALLGSDALNFHIVWADENFETDSILWCIDNANKYRMDCASDEEHKLSIESLRELLDIPENIRCCEPEEFTEHSLPKDFPPTVAVRHPYF